MRRLNSPVRRAGSKRGGAAQSTLDSLQSDRGNSIIEFVVVGVGIQLALLALVTSLAAQADSQLAADSMARQALRAMQLGVQSADLKAQLSELSSTFGLSPSDYSLEIGGDCSSTVTVAAQVRMAKAKLEAPCN